MSNSSTPSIEASGRGRAGHWTLLMLTLAYGFSFLDRTIVLTLSEALKKEMHLTDRQLGFLGGTTFAVFYGLLAIPIARVAERRSRVSILVGCLVIWSLMTALCGLAQTFVQLVLARIGVGTGEAGGQPTSHSLISDLFPVRQRATATALFQLGVPAGILTGAIAGGWVTQNISWRAAFVAVGMPGLLLAVLIKFTVREPKRGGMDAHDMLRVSNNSAFHEPPSIMAVFRCLGATPVFVHIILAAVLAAIAGNGINQFLHSFFLRNYGLGYAKGAMVFGVVLSVSMGVGTLLGGIACDRAGGKRRWMQPVIPAVGLAIGGPLAALGFGQPDWTSAALIILVSGILTSTYFAPIYSITHSLLEPRMRATGAAILTVGLGLISLGLGPVLAGAASDFFAATRYAGNFAIDCKAGVVAALPTACNQAVAQGLTNALMAGSLIYLWAAAHFALAARAMAKADLR